MKKTFCICLLFVLSIVIWHEAESMNNTVYTETQKKGSSHSNAINRFLLMSVITNIGMPTVKSSLQTDHFTSSNREQDLTPPKRGQENYIHHSQHTSFPYCGLKNTSQSTRKKRSLTKTPVQRISSEFSQKLCINRFLKKPKKYSKNSYQKRENTTETLTGMLHDLTLHDDEDDDHEDEDDDKEELSSYFFIDDKIDDFYMKTKEWWAQHGHEQNVTLLWWKDHKDTWKWHGKNDIDIPLIPDGFRINIIQKKDSNDELSLTFECEECQRVVLFTDMYECLTRQIACKKFDYNDLAEMLIMHYWDKKYDGSTDDGCMTCYGGWGDIFADDMDIEDLRISFAQEDQDEESTDNTSSF